ncbi:MAG TPA: nicotinate-nucleotide diphosphorylase (carboxylating), partial [Solirubrobacteraceae bacterium]|nr:nicotinate-nucleotide diphosphorylase (carboxylating) [Solirubrobacteraceae bacterium]
MSELSELVERALREDVGAGDVTTIATVEPDTRTRALITQKAPGVIFGADAAEAVFTRLDPDAEFELL